MRRPTRTRRLSIAALASCVVLMAMMLVCIRSFKYWDGWIDGPDQQDFILAGGAIVYTHVSGSLAEKMRSGHMHGPIVKPSSDFKPLPSFLGFVVARQSMNTPQGNFNGFGFRLPLWFPAALLLIDPICWVIGRPKTVNWKGMENPAQKAPILHNGS